MKTAVSQTEPSARSLFASLVPPEAGERFSFLWLSNFESERFWTNQRAVQLPKISQPADSAIVNRLEEMVLFLAESPDTVVLRERSDPAFLDYVSSYGYRLPTILETGAAEKGSSISESILANDDVHTIIPGMRKIKNVEANIASSDGKMLDKSLLLKLKEHRWDRTPTVWSQ